MPSKDFHPLFRERLSRFGIDSDDPNLSEFLDSINKDYIVTAEALGKNVRAVKDITEESDSQLRAERDILRAVVSSIKDGLLILSADLDITFINEAASELMGYAHGFLLGSNLKDYLQSDSPLAGKVASTKIQGRMFETQMLRRGGTPFPVQFSIAPVKSSTANIEGFVIVFRDITAQKQFEANIERAREEAVQASNLKSEFLATMSHEIRTPINGILSLAQLLLYSELDEEQRYNVESLESCAVSLKQMISNILDLSKIEAGKLVIDEVDFDLRRLVKNVEKQFVPQFAEKKIESLFEIDKEVPASIKADSVRIQQILVNLVGNAVKFTGMDGAVIVRVKYENMEVGAHGIRIVVGDTGLGIPEEKQQLIFEAFRQADNSTTREYGGTGLGLTICSELTKLLSGQIWVKSINGFGTAFHVFLPIGDSCGLLTNEVSSVRRALDLSYKPARLLLAEDNRINQEAISGILRAHGHEVVIASNGKEVLAVLSQSKFDVVLMDLHMPVVDGFESSKQIRASNTSYKDIPIVALTAYAVKGVEETCKEAGMNDFITKPIDYKQLLKAIEKYVNP